MIRTTKEDVKYWDDILDQYEQSIGLPLYKDDSMLSEE